MRQLFAGKPVIAASLALAATLVHSANPKLLQEFTLNFEPGTSELTAESHALLAILSGCNRPVAQGISGSASGGALPTRQKFTVEFEPNGSGLTAESRALIAILAGCVKGSASYVVLLPSPDGTVGRVVVQNKQGEQALTEAYKGLALDGSGPSFAVTSEQLKRDFSSAMTARPKLPEQFLLYFKLGSTDLTDESKALIPRILQSAREREPVVIEGNTQRGTLDVSVIGHTDTLGKPADNIILGFNRAGVAAKLLQQPGFEKLAISVESQGESNPLVATPDSVGEPRNRRVEITLR